MMISFFGRIWGHWMMISFCFLTKHAAILGFISAKVLEAASSVGATRKMEKSSPQAFCGFKMSVATVRQLTAPWTIASLWEWDWKQSWHQNSELQGLAPLLKDMVCLRIGYCIYPKIHWEIMAIKSSFPLFLDKPNHVVGKCWLYISYYGNILLHSINNYYILLSPVLVSPKAIVNHPHIYHKWMGFQPSKDWWFIIGLLTLSPILYP